MDQNMWHINTTETYLAIRKDESLHFAGTWMKLEGAIIFNEISL